MSFFSIIPQYISWHYTVAFFELFLLWKNFSWFLWNFFSIKILFKTLLAPFRRLDVGRKKFDVESFFESLVVNTLMRLLGLILRSVLIILGILSLCFLFIFFVGFLLLWVLLPFILLGMLILGFVTVFRTTNI